MSKNNCIDIDVFKGLTCQELVQHVVPVTFEGHGPKALKAKRHCIQNAINYFFHTLNMTVELAPRHWKTTRFAKMVGEEVVIGDRENGRILQFVHHQQLSSVLLAL
jgi:hypothetical protein